MKKLVYIAFATLILAACSSKTEQEQLAELKKKRNELQTELKHVNAEIETMESAGKGSLESKQTFVTIQKINKGVFQHYVNSQGDVFSDNNIMIPVEYPGIVEKIFAEEGDKVMKGQKVAQIDAILIKKQIEEIETGLAFARDVFERRERLWKKNIGSEIEYLQAKNNVDNLEKSLATARAQMEKATIKAPISGRIDEVILKEGEMAAAGMPAARIIQLSEMKIKTSISERYLNQVNKGNLVYVTPANTQKKYESKVLTVASVINADNRTFAVEVELPEADEVFSPNMIMDLSILNYQKEDVLSIPTNLIQKTENKSFTFVAVKAGSKWTAKKCWIETGKTYNNMVEILQGLTAEDMIITAGYQGLADGQEIVINK